MTLLSWLWNALVTWLTSAYLLALLLIFGPRRQE